MKLSQNNVKMTHSKVCNYVKSGIAMSHLRCLCEIFPWSCHKMTYSEVKVTERCHNDRIALIDKKPFCRKGQAAQNAMKLAFGGK